MKIQVDIAGKSFEANLDQPLSISIPIRESSNPNCYYTDPVLIEPVRSGDFIGSIKRGGVVNHKQITIAPHGNGTHTECSGHIFDNGLTINKVLTSYNFPAQLISIVPKKEDGISFISDEQIDFTSISPETRALIIRTFPNDEEKLAKNYSGTNPPYLSETAVNKIVENNINHLIVDLPSIDPESDNGRLLSHRAFWRSKARENGCTITELAYIPDSVKDGFYLLNLQALRMELDASPSNPVLYSLSSI